MQDALYEVTGRRTVPQVFIKGAFIGGADGALVLLYFTACLFIPCLCRPATTTSWAVTWTS